MKPITLILATSLFHSLSICSTTMPPRIAKPISWGILLFPSYEPLDVFGPLEVLSSLHRSEHLELSLISTTLDPVTTRPRVAAMNPLNSSVFFDVLPTHTLETAPKLDVLLVPGGAGTRAPDLQDSIDFIRDIYPSLKYLLTVCTGAGLAARAGVLDGKRATTNKASWNQTVALGPKVKWVPRARWVEDGNIWTSSGVSAGIDLTLAFVDKAYGKGTATKAVNFMEYIWNDDPNEDPFADIWHVPGA